MQVSRESHRMVRPSVFRPMLAPVNQTDLCKRQIDMTLRTLTSPVRCSLA